MVNEEYKNLIEIVKKPGVYVDKRSNFMVKVTKDEILTKSRDGKTWDRYVTSVANPNKRRYLKYSNRQALGK